MIPVAVVSTDTDLPVSAPKHESSVGSLFSLLSQAKPTDSSTSPTPPFIHLPHFPPALDSHIPITVCGDTKFIAEASRSPTG